MNHNSAGKSEREDNVMIHLYVYNEENDRKIVAHNYARGVSHFDRSDRGFARQREVISVHKSEPAISGSEWSHFWCYRTLSGEVFLQTLARHSAQLLLKWLNSKPDKFANFAGFQETVGRDARRFFAARNLAGTEHG